MLTKDEIIQGNILIALFMGWRIDNTFPDKGRVYRLGGHLELDTTFKFHQSWDALMPAIQKHCDSFNNVGNPNTDRFPVRLSAWFMWADSESKVRDVEDAWKYLVLELLQIKK